MSDLVSGSWCATGGEIWWADLYSGFVLRILVSGIWWAVFSGRFCMADFAERILVGGFVWAVLYGRFCMGGFVWAVLYGRFCMGEF